MRLLLLSVLAYLSLAQHTDYPDYQDYADYQDDYQQEDNLYADYANNQALKAAGG